VFTQCSKCETVFRLSADALRAAGGQVRCGRCGEVFNALSRLAEDAAGFTSGESPLFLESRAREILESSAHDIVADPEEADAQAEDPAAEAPAADNELPPGVEMAELEFLGAIDDELAAETSLEFTLPPKELHRVFIDTLPTPLQQLTLGRNSEDDAPAHSEETLPAHPEASSPTVAEPVALDPAASRRTRIAGLEISEAARHEILHSRQRTEYPEFEAAHSRLQFVAWLAAAVVLAAALAVQLVRGNGDWLATHAPLLGVTASPAAALSAYQLRQWGVTGDPGAKGTLRVRTTLMNTTAQLQPFPLLRVTLLDRAGGRVAARDFEPAEYLGHTTPRMLAPGERADAMLDIQDPGKEAEGFEIDACLRGADKQVLCAGDLVAPAK